MCWNTALAQCAWRNLLDGRLSYARLAKEMSEQQMAEAIGVRPEDIKNWERATLPEIYLQQLAAILIWTYLI
jgi:transcriptional regulator with XRE-family HTH domain